MMVPDPAPSTVSPAAGPPVPLGPSDAAQLSAIFGQATVGLSQLSLQGRFLRVNDELCRMLGRSRAALMQLGVPDVTHPDDLPHSLAAVGRLAADGVAVSLDKRYVRADGGIVWANSSVSRLDPVAPGAPHTLLAVTVDLTERFLAKQALARSEARFRALAEAAPLYIWQVDPDGHSSYLNPKCRELAGPGRPLDLALPVPWAAIVHADDRAMCRAAMEEANASRQPRQWRTRLIAADTGAPAAPGGAAAEGPRWHQIYTAPWFEDSGAFAGLVAIAIDISEPVRLQDAIVIAHDRLALAVQASGDGIWDWDIGRDQIAYSARMLEMMGLAATSDSEPYQAWCERIHREDRVATLAALDDCLADRSAVFSAEFRVAHAGGGWRWFKVRGLVVARDASGGAVRMTGAATDISGQRASQEMIWAHANFDALTGLPNRRLFRDRLDQEIRSARRTGSLLGLLFIDLDHFKEVNDLLGHDAGDQLLVQAAIRIAGCVRSADTVARLGGDEFTTILIDFARPADVESVARKIGQALAVPFTLGAEAIHLSASIGITIYPADGEQSEQLIRHADQAMYVAKSAGRDQYSYFTPSMQTQAQERLRLIADLRHALGAGQFEVYYQPVVELESGRVVKAEALLRWHHPQRGFMQPSQFIPHAEEAGLIAEIGDWVFYQAAACAQRWRRVLGPHFQISVNRSPVQFMARGRHSNWPSYLASRGMSGASMSVEITEAVLLNASDRVSAQLRQFHDAGIEVGIDDFGTGYSSLAYLKKFEIDYLKIDRTFVKDMNDCDSDRAIVRSVAAMAKELGLDVIAEGIESEPQAAALLDAGCGYGQGYHFSRPVAAALFESRFIDGAAGTRRLRSADPTP